MIKKTLVKNLPQTQVNIFLDQKKYIKENGVNFTAFMKWSLTEKSDEFVEKISLGGLEVCHRNNFDKGVKSLPLEPDYRNIINDKKINLAEFGRWVIDMYLKEYIKNN